ncbi:SCO4402 family protein [Rhizohabitans arisaemae]|uniref:SCO4402 family protein n=1 Tax=Rhizohabitans arisaemae TaxID=2720610 RepID=UPI0024B14C33|nr:hypothetical protein [Rhizohabitans arisaemae]
MVEVVDMAHSMSDDVRFPEMRREIISAVNALASPEHQQRVWIDREYPHPGYYDDFTLNIHILYDDTDVLENTSSCIGDYLRSQDEVDALTKLAAAIDAMFAALGTELEDLDYMRSPFWGSVVSAAAAAVRVLANEGDQSART